MEGESTEDMGSGIMDYGLSENSENPINYTFLAIQCAWYSFVLILGITGNVYIILTVWCRKDMCSTTNLFIVNLAFSDLGILLISLPAEFIKDYVGWPFDKLTCQIFAPLNEVFFCVSILTLTVITIERFRAICRPFKPHLTQRKAKVIIIIVWFVSYLTVGFPMSFLMDVQESQNHLRCGPKWSGDLQRRIHTCFIATLIIVPLFITAGGYAAIVSAMKRQSARIRARANSLSGATVTFRHDQFRLEKNAELIKMLLLIVVVFWICMLPLTLLALAIDFGGIDPTTKAVDLLYTLGISLFFSNSAFNPVAVYMMSSELRKGLYAFLDRISKYFDYKFIEVWKQMKDWLLSLARFSHLKWL